jgi:excisionase family DNA binding protein
MTDTMTETLDLLYGVKEIANYLGVKPRTAEYWIEHRRIPVKRMGRTICARRSSLDAAFDMRDEPSAA